jgi:hypothetical protein
VSIPVGDASFSAAKRSRDTYQVLNEKNNIRGNRTNYLPNVIATV